MSTGRKRRLIGISIIVAAGIVAFVANVKSPNETRSQLATPGVALLDDASVSTPHITEQQLAEPAEKQVPDDNPVDFTFGDGEWIKVSWRRSDWDGNLSPPLGHQYAGLHEKASSGDRFAAYKLFNILEHCKGSVESMEQLDASIESIRMNWEFSPPSGGQPIPVRDDDMLERVVSRMESTYENCTPITSEQTADAEKWLKLAADGGPTVAMIHYGSTLEDLDQRAEIFEWAWSIGNVLSLNMLGQTYLAQYESGAQPGHNVKAYSAYYASAILEEQSTVAAGLDPTRVIDRNTKTLERVGNSLRPPQIELAIAEAVEMLKANTNCCTK